MEFLKRTDLAVESAPFNTSVANNNDYEITNFSSYGIDCIKVVIKTTEGEKICKRKIGTYITIICGKVWIYEESVCNNVKLAICDAIRSLLEKKPSKKLSFLIAGLGNRFITSDSLGPICIDKMGFMGGSCLSSSIFLIAPGVFAQSGLESKALIKCAIDASGASHLILIDALASGSIERLCSTIQISNTGLCPGSGTNESRAKISESELGIPIISIGVPTVVNLSSIIFDSVKECKIEKVPPCVYNSLNKYSELFVCPKEIDAIISTTSSLIVQAIEMAIKKENGLLQ